jgi:hypothetical protein
MEEWEPVPVEVMIACFVAAGFIVSVVYSIDWNQLL